MDLFMKQTQGHREQTWVARGEERGGLGGWDSLVQTAVCRMDKQ